VSTPKNPFVGLRPFETADYSLFFGRDAQVEDLLERLRRTRFLAVVGCSGCGKSSLVRAGLIPALEAGFLVHDRDAWTVVNMKPGDSPIRNLAATLERLSRALSATTTTTVSAYTTDAIAQAIEEGDVAAILRKFEPVLRDTNRNVLMLVDQFEELFRFSGHSTNGAKKEEAAGFVDALLAFAEQRMLPFYIVLTMRSDFLGYCDTFHGLPEAMNRSLYLVPRLTRRQRQEAIEGPIRLIGGSVAPRLLDRLLNAPHGIRDDHQPDDEGDQLPVLQHAMMRTWEQHQQHALPGQPVDIQHYVLAGTLSGALEQDADAALKDSDRELTRGVFQALTDTDAANRQIRRPAKLSELQALTGAPRARILAELNRFRAEDRCFLVWSDQESDPSIDISHESLIRRWSTLREWVREEAASADQYKRLAKAAERHARHEEGLWTDPQLQLALTWEQEQRPSRAWAERHVSGTEFEQAIGFLAESKEAALEQKREEEQQRQRESERETALVVAQWREKRNRLLVAGAIVVTTAGTVTFTRIQYQRELTTQLLARQSRDVRETTPQQSVLLAVEALKANARVKAGENALRAALVGVGGRGLGGHASEIRALALSRSGRWLVTASVDSVRRWDLTNRQPELTSTTLWSADAKSTLSEVRTLAIAPNETVVALGREDGRVLIASLGGAASPPTVLQGHESPLSALAFSHDGKWLFSGSEDGSLWRWSLRTLSQGSTHKRMTATGRHEAISIITVDPSDRWLVTSITPRDNERNQEGEAQLWSLTEGDRPVWRRAGVSTVDVDSNGTYLITGDVNGSVMLWRLGRYYTASADTNLRLAPEIVLSCAAAPGSSRPEFSNRAITSIASTRKAGHDVVAAGGAAGQMCLWTLDDSEGKKAHPIVLSSNGPAIEQLRFSPDAHWLAIAYQDAAVRLLRDPCDDAIAEGVDLRGHDEPVRALAFTPDSLHLVSGSSDGTARLWSLEEPDPSSTSIVRRGGGKAVSTVSLSSSGRWYFEGQKTGSGQLWDLERGADFTPLRAADGDPVIEGKISADERWLTARTAGGKLQLWSLGDRNTPEPRVSDSDASAFDLSACGPWFVAAVRDHVIARQLSDADLTNRPLEGHSGRGQRIDKVAAGRNVFAAVSKDGPVHLWKWNGSTFSESDLPGRVPAPIAMSISCRDRWLAIGEPNRILVWDLSRPTTPPRELQGQGSLTALDMSRDERWLIAGTNDGSASVYDLPSSKSSPAHVWGGHQGTVLTVVMSPDSQSFATGGQDGDVKLWNLSDRLEDPAILPAHDDGIASAVFLPDGKLMTASMTGVVRHWRIGAEGLLDQARVFAGRNLSALEWKKYFPSRIACRPTFPDLPDRCVDQSREERAPSGQAINRWALK